MSLGLEYFWCSHREPWRNSHGHDSLARERESCLYKRDNDMAELMKYFREAVNEEDGTLRLVREGAAYLRVGLLDPGLTVLCFGNGSGWRGGH